MRGADEPLVLLDFLIKGKTCSNGHHFPLEPIFEVEYPWLSMLRDIIWIDRELWSVSLSIDSAYCSYDGHGYLDCVLISRLEEGIDESDGSVGNGLLVLPHQAVQYLKSPKTVSKHKNVRHWLMLVLLKYRSMKLADVVSYRIDGWDENGLALTPAVASHVHCVEVVARITPLLAEVSEPLDVLREPMHVKDDAFVLLVTLLAKTDGLLQTAWLLLQRVEVSRIGVVCHV